MLKKLLSPLIVVLVLALSGCGYNRFQSYDEDVKSSWSEVLNQYQRRADLVPNLVNVVKGYAAHEKDVLEGVTQARANATAMNLSGDVLSDEQALKKFQQVQAGLSSSLGRLLAVAENYPQLKADASFRDLQAQLEGTENRITVARKRYIDSVKEYNVLVRSFPSNLTAKVFGYSAKANFSVENESVISKPPSVDFSK
ncbi:MAG: LemA family protein [Oligoflexia bacterium]|nr:LemA family protein [Oligoflexia bacterium]